MRQLAARRDHLHARLESVLNQRKDHDAQVWWRSGHVSRRNRLQASLQQAQAALAQKKVEVGSTKRQVEERSLALARASAKKVVSSELARVRRSFIRQLRFILPLRLAMVDVPDKWDGSARVTQPVRICGTRLPDADDPRSVSDVEVGASL
eukprot:jgi/Mesen1/5415/ME000269S04560